jgi:hypothetical protein
MTLIDLGKLRFYWADSWSSATEYELNDVVKYGGNAYVYTNAVATTGNLPTNTTYFKTMVEGINFLGVYSSGTAYRPGDAVTHGGNLYLCENPSTGNTPPNATYWSKLASGIQYEGVFSSSGTYQKDDIVSYGGSVYIALQDTAGSNAPSSSANTAYWAKLVDGTYPDQASNANKILKTDGTSVSWTDAISIASGTVSADLTVGDQAFVGPGAATFAGAGDADLTNPALVVRFDNGETEDSFAQIAFQNDDPTSSTDIIAYMDNGDDSEGWMGMGIAGSQFNDATYGITAPGDGYIFANTKAGNGRNGNLVIATGDAGDQNKLVFAAGGFASGDTQMSITPASTGVDGNVHIETPTDSVSPTTGALTVVGGVGISGDINVLGDMSIVGNFTFGGGSTSAENLAVTNPLVFVGDGNNADTQDLGLVGEYSTPVTISTATVNNKALTDNVATLTTAAAHNFLVGDRVTVAGVDATFNGTYALTAVTSTTFSYAKTNANVTSAAVSPTGTADAVTRREFAGAVRDASDGVFKFFQDAVTKPSSTVNFAQAGLTYADIQVDDITADQITGTGNLTIATDKLTVNASTGAVAMSGLVTASGGITSSGTFTQSGGAVFTGTTDMQELRENVVDVTLASNVATLDWTAGNIYYIATAPSSSMTFNATNVPTDASKIMTINVLVTQGSTGYIPTVFQIAGSSNTIRWAGGSAPTPTSSAGKIDIFSFTLQRTSGGAWIVYGSSSLNF